MHSGVHLASKKNIQRIRYANGQDLMIKSEDKYV